MVKKKLTVTIALIVLIGLMFLALRPLFWKPATVEKTTFPIFVLDDLGRNVAIVKNPERIVSTTPSNTEILFALGLGNKVVGVTMYCDYPPEVKERTKVGNITIIGGFADPSLEKITALEPDLVLGTGGIQKLILERMERLNLTVVVLDSESVDDVFESIKLVGKITGHTGEAQELITNMEQRVKVVTDKTKSLPDSQRPRVYYEVSPEPLMSAGPDTFIDSLIQLAGGSNIFKDAKTRYPIINLEVLVERNPEVIIISNGKHGGVTAEELKARGRWQNIAAVNNNRVYSIDANLLVRPGPRIVDGLEQMAKYIHPELFGEE